MAENSQENSRAKHLKPFNFKKGQSGNPGGRPKRKPISERYEHFVEERAPDDVCKRLGLEKGSKYGDAIALGQIQAAVSETVAAREVREGIEGKAVQPITTPEDKPFIFHMDSMPKKFKHVRS